MATADYTYDDLNRFSVPSGADQMEFSSPDSGTLATSDSTAFSVPSGADRMEFSTPTGADQMEFSSSEDDSGWLF